MPNVKFITKTGQEITLFTPFYIGDIVKVTSAGCQYTTYSHAFEHFWGSNTGSYQIPHKYNSYKPMLPDKKNVWTIVGMVGNGILNNTIMYFIRSQDRRKVVMGEDGIKLIKHGAIKIVPDKVKQLCR